MNNQLTSSASWRGGENYPSPVQKVLAFGYYDGPTEGFCNVRMGKLIALRC
jgi:hypothetical protein